MRDYFIAAVTAIAMFAAPAAGIDSPCGQKAVHFIRILHDKESDLTLDAKRVMNIRDDAFTYNLGWETITIIPRSFAAERFQRDVAQGLCSATQQVRLIPVTGSPFNTRFYADRPH